MSIFSSQKIPLLVVGYGDRNQGDYSAGRRVAKVLKQSNSNYLRAISVYQLSSSLAPLLAKAQIVIFVGVYQVFKDMKPELQIKHFLPNYDQPEIGIPYPNPPHSLLSLVKSTYGVRPDTYWILIPALGNQQRHYLSNITRHGIRSALDYLIGEQHTNYSRPKNSGKCRSCKQDHGDVQVPSYDHSLR